MAAAKTPEKETDLVPFKLPRARNGESDTQFIGYNGRPFLIKRGVEVMVPPGVVSLYNDSLAAQDVVDDIIDDTKFKDPMIRG